MKFEDMKIWWNKQGNTFRWGIRKGPITAQVLAELLLMAVAGVCTVLLAQQYPDTSLTTRSKIVMYADTDQRTEIEEKTKEAAEEEEIEPEGEPTDNSADDSTDDLTDDSPGDSTDDSTDDSEQQDDSEEMNRSGEIENRAPMDSAIRLNMAFLYPEGSSDPMDSYAGQVYTALSERDSAWIAEIYGLSDHSPSILAEKLGIQLESGVNAESWESVTVSFYDGDGRPISGYSNAREIVSLASVYAYYNGITDKNSFISYADSLWRNSHRYDISIGDVYYCDGACMETAGIDDGQMQSEYSIPKEDAVQDENPEESLMDEASAADAVNAFLETANPLEAAKIFDLKYSTNTAESVHTASEETTVQNADDFPAEPSAASQKKCAGHIDLKVNAYITGLNGTKNLFMKDTIGNDQSQWTDRWRGWSRFCRLYAKGIEQLDWYKAYGLTFSTSMYIRNPLSASEISDYMEMLPEGTSEKRKKVIKQALLSVGCIPYYWGGKPSTAGFEGNGFGTIVSPDKNGRILRGLDCSGWISWVYWTALDQKLNYQSTAGLIAEGQATTRIDLQPGGIILRTGDDSHVYMFMTWAEDGGMYLIHETGGSTNNVMIGRYQLDWPYYRNLINEE